MCVHMHIAPTADMCTEMNIKADVEIYTACSHICTHSALRTPLPRRDSGRCLWPVQPWASSHIWKLQQGPKQQTSQANAEKHSGRCSNPVVCLLTRLYANILFLTKDTPAVSGKADTWSHNPQMDLIHKLCRMDPQLLPRRAP